MEILLKERVGIVAGWKNQKKKNKSGKTTENKPFR